jgi:Mrp family chromosome partitioning ATPase
MLDLLKNDPQLSIEPSRLVSTNPAIENLALGDFANTSSRGQGNGQVITVWGPVGSPGKSTIAANLACELAVAGQSVFLLDADTYAPSQADLFGVFDQPEGLSAACRILEQERFDLSQLQRLSFQLAIGRKSLTLMSGMGSTHRWVELTPSRLINLLNVAKSNFDFVIVDVASSLETGLTLMNSNLSRNSAARTALDYSNKVIAVSAADPLSIQRFLSTISKLPLSGELSTVINRFRAGALGARAKQQIVDTFARFANLSIDAFIPEDLQSLDSASLNSVPLAMAKRGSMARVAIAQYARTHILGERSQLDRRLAKLG